MKTVMTIFLTLLMAFNALATAQYPDKLLYDGKEYGLHTNPMEQYFRAYPEKKPSDGVRSSALWRGYVATFEIKTNTLILKDIEVMVWSENCRLTSWKSVKDRIVTNGEDLVVDWFTGLLVLPYGETVKYVHMGYDSTYENYIVLEVKAGSITGERKFDYHQYKAFKEKQFNEYIKTEDYKKKFAELKNKGRDPDKIDKDLRRSIIMYTSEFLDE
ncbi:MAG: hypothetical protein FJ220_07405 [Kiritimatiellaceae bacterium]|nr:hypothetical protein [Kiritimatiellaceae bacterium]